MPDRASCTGYQPLSQSVDDEADVGLLGAGLAEQRPTSSPRGLGRARPGSIDLKKLDNAFKRWTESIAQKVKRKHKKKQEHSKKQIWKSVFEPQVLGGSIPDVQVKTLDHKPPMTQEVFESLVQSVKSAIEEGIHPKMISKGSSGSYFARAKVPGGRVQSVAVFKPKDEEPYGRLNPKVSTQPFPHPMAFILAPQTTKWIHRQFRWIIPFGRACLIPNLSYISEAAASLLDRRLELHVVPPTYLVSLSSPAFFYDWLDRSAVKKGKPLPEKIGSMQYFLHGYVDASEFLRKHPWPGRAIADTFDDSNHRHGNISKRILSALNVMCGKTGDGDELYDEVDYEDERVLFDATETSDAERPFYWTQALQQSFREELEKLVILDYLMLNTDRGADNYMIKFCEGDHEKTLVDVAPTRSVRLEMPLMSELKRTDNAQSSTPRNDAGSSRVTTTSPALSESPPNSDYTRRPHIHIAAIDNSLSFPHEHPQGWRSYTYGWLYLPVSLIGRPFSEKTRNHFLPLLTSKTWWEETTFQLRKLFAVDPDFHPKMFSRQIAVIKGQAWNIVQSLKHSVSTPTAFNSQAEAKYPFTGPLELTRRQKVLVWDDEIEVVEGLMQEAEAAPAGAGTDTDTTPPSPRISISSVPVPRRTRSQSSGGEFPPPMRRTSTDASGLPRPVPFVAKFQRIHPGTTGVTILEHLERLDAVEASLKRLGVDEVEVDVGEAIPPRPLPVSRSSSGGYRDVPGASSSSAPNPSSPFSPPGSPLPTVPEVGSSASSIAEEDLVAMSKSTSHVEGLRKSFGHDRYESVESTHMEWIHPTNESTKRNVIVERLETVDRKPLCSCW
ncbi:Phosphatidylinositol 4-kinase lsb6 [Leucoagaricus sp. SymC.cos]|nr:Phosphatidylinositol 4-kinase lsb6 [Leucoagaricus sp. SymC.cos]